MYTNLGTKKYHRILFFFIKLWCYLFFFLILNFKRSNRRLIFLLNIHVLSKSTFLKFKILYDYRTWQSLLHTCSVLIKNQTLWLIWASGENTVTIPDVSKRIMVPKSSWWTIYASFAISLIQSSPIFKIHTELP